MLKFSNKLVLNQWLISLFGIDPLAEHSHNGQPVRPFHVLSRQLRDCREGLETDGLHFFYHQLKNHWQPGATMSPDALLVYEQNILEHTRWLNENRERPIEWKYYQWLTLLFSEIYFHQYFSDRHGLLNKLNDYVVRFNQHWAGQGINTGITPYSLQQLNKVCLQNATGSGKTLLMHINYRQFAHYAKQAGQLDQITRTLLITPNEGLSGQHELELRDSGIEVSRLVMDNNDMFSSQAGHMDKVDFIEITKLGDRDGPKTIATRNLGDQNLILVDEGHRGMGKSEEEGWFRQREKLVERGFAIEYSATFREAVSAANNARIEEAYAKAVLFDYSYRYFYEDGYGKDYRIYNLPRPESGQSLPQEFLYLTACLLSFYQQLRLYAERKADYLPYNLEKPLWVFVGSSVSKASANRGSDADTVTDVVQVLHFFAQFLSKPDDAIRALRALLDTTGNSTGLVDDSGNDIFNGAFLYIRKKALAGETIEQLHRDILARLFNNPAGGRLQLQRLKGDSGELVLRCGTADNHFGLINVGDSIGLSRHVEEVSDGDASFDIEVTDSDFLAAQFATIKNSTSPINLLMGAKKFIEGWDCWRVSTLGLMRVGRSEGSQIIQLFGRGVRLKGYEWSLKRSRAATPVSQPEHIGYLETLNVFGVQADFMEKFRDFLKQEGLPSNDNKYVVQIPMNLTYDFGQKLKVLRPKRRGTDGREYNFNRDGATPLFGAVPEWLQKNPVTVDWYPKIQAIVAQGQMASAQTAQQAAKLEARHLAFLDYKALYFELEAFKARENLYSLIIEPQQIAALLQDTSWYVLYASANILATDNYGNVRIWNQIALELLKKYAKKYFMYCADAFIRPRLEVRELDANDPNLPKPDEQYSLSVDASEAQLIADLDKLKQDIAAAAGTATDMVSVGRFNGLLLDNHLYDPLLFMQKGTSVSVAPVTLNDSEFQFVSDLKDWLKANQQILIDKNQKVFLLRNKTRGSGVGFFEAGNFYPDFIVWIVEGTKQKVIFVEPHGMRNEGPQSSKVLFHKTIKEIQARLGDPSIELESFILSPTPFGAIQNQGLSVGDWNNLHVLFMQEQKSNYIDVIFS